MRKRMSRGGMCLLTCAAALFVSAAQAEERAGTEQQRCGPYSVLREILARNYGESPVFNGQINEAFVLQVFLNRKSGSWTSLLVHQSGKACIGGVGKGGAHDLGL